MASFGTNIIKLANTLGSSLGEFATNTAQQAIQGTMGHNANLVSAQGQHDAMEFNQQSANIANAQNMETLANQYQFNAAQASMANEYNESMWQRAADWNDMMWEKQAKFNAEQAQIQRDWQTNMANTQYQRAINDMSAAGLNPILAVTGGGVGTNIPGGATASVGGASMSSAQSAMASGGVLGSNSGSVGGYQGQLEFQGGALQLLSQAIGELGSAARAFGAMGDFGEEVGHQVSNVVFGKENGEKAYKMGNAVLDKWKAETSKNGLMKGTWNTVKDTGKAFYNTFIKNDGSKEFTWRSGHAKG